MKIENLNADLSWRSSKVEKAEESKMNNSHPRYSEIPFETCRNTCPNGGTPLRIILFKSDQKFRSHAVKHLANTLEIESAWGSMLSIQRQWIIPCIDKLRDLGCPFFEKKYTFDSPPCLINGHPCYSFEQCTVFANQLEREYLGLSKKALEEGGRIPRYACFADGKGNSFCWVLPDRKVIAKAAFHVIIYNLMTCCGPGGNISWQEMREVEKRKMSIEAYGKSIIWCQEDKWGISYSPMDSDDAHEEKSANRQEKRQKTPYYRQRGGGWQKYLEETDE